LHLRVDAEERRHLDATEPARAQIQRGWALSALAEVKRTARPNTLDQLRGAAYRVLRARGHQVAAGWVRALAKPFLAGDPLTRDRRCR